MKRMRTTSSVCVMILLLCSTAPGSSPVTAAKQTPPPEQSPLAVACERQLKSIEQNIVDAAEAMPEEKFDFTPESMNIQGSAFTSVRTFAGQVKHLATDNFAIWSPITGDPMPAGIKREASSPIHPQVPFSRPCNSTQTAQCAQASSRRFRVSPVRMP